MQLASNSVQLELRQNCMLIYMQQLPSALIAQLVANRVASKIAQQVAACKLGLRQRTRLLDDLLENNIITLALHNNPVPRNLARCTKARLLQPKNQNLLNCLQKYIKDTARFT